MVRGCFVFYVLLLLLLLFFKIFFIYAMENSIDII